MVIGKERQGRDGLYAQALSGSGLWLGLRPGPAQYAWAIAQLALHLCPWSPLHTKLPHQPSFDFSKHRKALWRAHRTLAL